jgi:hypothetical protein
MFICAYVYMCLCVYVRMCICAYTCVYVRVRASVLWAFLRLQVLQVCLYVQCSTEVMLRITRHYAELVLLSSHAPD